MPCQADRSWANGTRRSVVVLLLAVLVAATQADTGRPLPEGARLPLQSRSTPQASSSALPNKDNSLKFCVLGDFGTGERTQYELANQMIDLHGRFKYQLVVLVGDNLYGSERPQDFQKKFELPYKALLDDGVKFYASLGNHDAREQRYYKLFNMDGKLYYTFKAPAEDVRFFALETAYMDPDQMTWLEDELKKSSEKWKIVFFHHPLYSSARTHGSQVTLRAALEPLFVQYNVSVVLNGHDHTYERIKPQNGIQYFVEGSSGQLRSGDLRRGSPLTAAGNDSEQAFMLMEIDGDTLTFNAITKSGAVIDSGVIAPRK